MATVDDHGGIAIDKPFSNVHAARMDASFDRGRSAYAKAGLAWSASKAVRRARSDVTIGAEVLFGRDNVVGSERSKRLQLSRMTMSLVQGRLTTGSLLRKLLSA